MWEQRYGILCPERTTTNIRTYCEGDLRRLLNVATLCARGQRISQVARLSDEQLHTAVLACYDGPSDYVRQLNELLTAMLEMDEYRLNCLLDSAIEQLGFEVAGIHIVYPLLQRVGVLWQTGTVNPAQEHLLKHLVRQKMVAAIDGLPSVPPTAARRWVLFLPAGELNELALLFMSHGLRARGHHVLYLGQNLPVTELPRVCAHHQPYALCTVLTSVPERDRVQAFVDHVTDLCPGAQLHLYGPLVQQEGLQLPATAIRHRHMTEFLTLADELRLEPAGDYAACR